MLPAESVRPASLPPLRADLLLLHPPAHVEFRDRDDLYFPYLSTSGDVPITPLYEYFPVGFKSLQRWLGARDFDVRILNLSTLLLRYPSLPLDAVLGALRVGLLGIDLHWMVHVQGSLAVAQRFKALQPEVPVVLGGISATYYAEELIRYPFVDFVLRGYDTHAPLTTLLEAVRAHTPPRRVPNLLWKEPGGRVVDNGFTHAPPRLACGVDWSALPEAPASRSLPILEVLSTQHVGCSYDCGWCGGSRSAFRRLYPRRRSVARKPASASAFEFETLGRLPNRERYHVYAVGTYNQTGAERDAFLEHVGGAGVKSISYEQYHLTPEPVLRRMAAANPRTSITLSPESSNRRIGTLAGRGVYSMEEMEDWIERALDLGIYQVDVWFFVGMPEQDAAAVRADVDYCGRLLRRFRGRRVLPYLCPMIPFLDPASTFFEEDAAHGYRVFHRTAEQHRTAMERASLLHRINYETRWLSRRDLVHVGYEAVRRLTELKAEWGVLPHGIARSVVERIDDARRFIDVVHEADARPDPADRERALAALGGEIRRRNDEILFAGVANQAFPVPRQVGGRWIDELGWRVADLEAAVPPTAAAPAPARSR